MLIRRYGTSYQSIELNFDSRAITEISFRRDREWSLPVEDFEVQFEKTGEESLVAEADGRVQSESEIEVLADLERQVRALMASAGEDEVLAIENEQGVDYPKLHDKKQTLVEEGENRLHFFWTVDPPLRIGRYRRR